MENTQNLPADSVYIALDIDGVLHSLFTDNEPEWKENLRVGNWTAAMFHAAVFDKFLKTPGEELEFQNLDKVYRVSYMLSQVPLLEAVLRRHPAARIVIASDWRRTMPLDLVCSLLPPDVAQRVVGATKVVPEKDEKGRAIPGIRSKLMLEWMKENALPDDTPWLAIDDGAILWKGEDERLIHTHFTMGLQHKDALKLDRQLSIMSAAQRAVAAAPTEFA